MAHFSPRLTPWAVLFRHSVAPWLMSYAPGIRPALPVVSLSLVAACCAAAVRRGSGAPLKQIRGITYNVTPKSKGGCSLKARLRARFRHSMDTLSSLGRHLKKGYRLEPQIFAQ